MKPITKSQLKRALDPSLNRFRKTVCEMLKAFYEYPDAVDITVNTSLTFTLKTNRFTRDINICPSTNSVISKSCYNCFEYSQLIVSDMIDDMLVELNHYHESLRYDYIKFEDLTLKDEGFDEDWRFRINKFLAWSHTEVALWYVEQECGEGWIKLPLNYKLPSITHTHIEKSLNN